MKIAYFDCSSGIAGSMILGALIDAGVSLFKLESELKKLKIPFRLTIKKVKKNGISSTFVEVETKEIQPHRGLKEINQIISKSKLSASVKNLSLRIFERLAAAESKIHGVPINKIRFHEVGAIDAIVDIVGSVIGLNELEIDDVYASKINLGRYAPATLELLKNIPVYSNNEEFELTTPTGAAIILTFAKKFTSLPYLKLEKTGFGAGSFDLSSANILKILIGKTEKENADTVTVIETNIDDMNPQIYEYLMGKLFDAGALDVYFTPIYMKKNRPATKITVISPSKKLNILTEIIFNETTSIGLRFYDVSRKKLEREEKIVKTKYGNLKVKVSKLHGKVLHIRPEYNDAVRLAKLHRIPLRRILNCV